MSHKANSVTIIVLQTPITRWFIEKVHPMNALSLGTLFIGGGLGSLFWSTNFYWLMLSGIIFIIGEMLIVPTMDSAISRLGTAQMIGVFFGIANFISGVGEGGGKYIGGQLLSLGTSSTTPWLTFAIASIVISLMIAALRYWKPLQTSLVEPSNKPGISVTESGQAGNNREEKGVLNRIANDYSAKHS